MPPLLVLAFLLCAESAAGQGVTRAADETYVAVAVRIFEKPEIDGVLDEPFWQTIPAISDFRQREPSEGAEPSERTEVRIAFDESFLYFGLTMFDSEPGKIRATILQREGRIDQDDRVIIALDTFLDRRNAYIFELNAFGTQGDALVTDEGRPSWDWEGVYWSEGRVTDFGWVLEVAIPFTTLRYGKMAEPQMGVAFYRSIRRKNEEAFWPLIGVDYQRHIYQVSQYGRLVGLGGLRRHRNVEVKPYGLMGAHRGGDAAAESVARDVGLDVKYGVSPSFTLDLTYNTDFAQVEADNVQINLTRFSLFFPEKREFFLERAGLFAFGEPGETTVFFSRRIGLTEDIFGGARLTGQTGRFSIGLLELQTRDTAGQRGTNYGVVRVRGDLGRRATAGGIFTNWQGGDRYSRTAGADLAIRFRGSSEFAAWIARVWSAEGADGAAAGSAYFALQSDRRSLELSYLNVGRNFDPAIGFVRRTDMVRYRAEAGFYPRLGTGDRMIRQLRFTAGGFYIQGQDGDRQSTAVWTKASARFESGDDAGLDVTRESEYLQAPFRLFSGPVVPVGDHGFTFTRAWLRTNSSRNAAGELSVGRGGFYNGRLASYAAGATFKVSKHLSLGGKLDRNYVTLPWAHGTFVTTAVGLTAFAAAGRHLFANTLVQYDSVSRSAQANIRVNWIHTPGSDLFVVFSTQRFLSDLAQLRPGSVTSAALVKLTYLVAF